MKIKIIFLLLCVSVSASAQISESNYQVLRKALTEKINQLRVSQEVRPLESNLILKKAAKIQSVFMVRIKKLTHKQGNPKFANPLKRVRHFDGFEFELVGENVLSTIPLSPPLRNKELESLAEEMFLSWKNSPGHYANMINSNYDFGGIDFQFDPKNKIIYATHVFGKKGVKIEGQLSDNAFGILNPEDPCEAYEGYSNIVANMGNSILVRGNKVMFYYHNLHYFNKIFSNSKDGIAIDIIYRDQLSCNGPNQLDYSPIYDGLLLKPIFKDEILRINEAESDYRIIAQVATIPDSLLSKEFSCSVVLIKDGFKCKYLMPGYVPSRKYNLQPIQPLLENPQNVGLSQSGIIESVELSYDFESNNTTPLKFPTIKKRTNPIHSIEITSFSSVEGTADKNAALHDQRAQTIKRHLQTKLNIKSSNISIDAKENWDKMYFQLRYNMANDLAELSKDSLKNMLANEDRKNQALPWDSLLFAQRKSIATINYLGNITDANDNDKIYKMNFRTAISNRNFDLANKALFEMYHSTTIPSDFLYDDVLFKSIIEHPAITQNVAAIFSKIYKKNYAKTVEFLFSWLDNEKDLSADAKFNLLNLYTLISVDLLDRWDLSAKRLSNVVHPLIVKNIVKEEDNLNGELSLNLNISFIEYFGQINDGPNISKSFDYISKYFKLRALKDKDVENLALFFNAWSSFGLTNDFLFEKFVDDELNKESVFILLQTLRFYSEKDIDFEKFEEVTLKAIELDSNKWCDWVAGEFQILRNQNIKDLYCEKCN